MLYLFYLSITFCKLNPLQRTVAMVTHKKVSTMFFLFICHLADTLVQNKKHFMSFITILLKTMKFDTCFQTALE